MDLLTEYRRENWRGIQTPEWQEKIVRSMVAYDEPPILKRIAPHWELPPKAVILDLGSGIGNFVVACRKRGLRAYGVEPDRVGKGAKLRSLQIARQRLKSPAFAAATGEQLPFRDATFDLVAVDQVLEHVDDQNRVVREAFRVLKPGGAMYVACPNYLRFYEPHYKLWFVPLLPKFLGSPYLRLRRRDPVLLNQLTYTTNWRVRKLLSRLNCRLLDLNSEDVSRSLAKKADHACTWKVRLLSRVSSLRLVSGVAAGAARFYIRLREGGCEFLAIKEAQKSLEKRGLSLVFTCQEELFSCYNSKYHRCI
jgi:ubiquinone/menaquinone biosynthesis C-methylase UbiE